MEHGKKSFVHLVWSALPEDGGDIGAPIYWRTDAPRAITIGVSIHPAPIVLAHWKRNNLHINNAGVTSFTSPIGGPNQKNLKRGAPNSTVRLAYFHTNCILNDLHIQETENVAEKKTATLKSKQTLIATVRYPILTVACFPTHLLYHYPLPLKCLDLQKIISISWPL